MGLDNDSITERFRELELERRRIEAEMAAVVAVADARGVYGDDGHRSIKGWMRANANWSGCDVSTMRRVVALFESCPAVGDALLAGHIGQAQVIELARARSNPRCGARLVEVLELLLDNAEHLSFEDFRTVVRRWEHFADEDGTLDDAETNHANRTAGLHEVNGCVDLRASGGRPLDAAEMLGIFERFVEDEFRADVAARTELHGPDAPASLLPRTDAQRRFDALLTDLPDGVVDAGRCPRSGAGRQHRVRHRDVRDVARPSSTDPVPRRSAAHRSRPVPLRDRQRHRRPTRTPAAGGTARPRSAGHRRHRRCGARHGPQATPVQGCRPGGGQADGLPLRPPRLHDRCPLRRGRPSRRVAP